MNMYPQYNEEQTNENNNRKSNKNGRVLLAFVLISIICISIGIMIGFAIPASLGRSDNGPSYQSGDLTSSKQTYEEPQTDSTPVPPIVNTSSKTDTSNVLTDIYKNSVNSVVGIIAEGTTTNIFGQKSSFASSGTGFIITDDGYILTNFHVIENSNNCTVSLYNGDSYPASVIGYEEDNDIAVLKIETDGELPVIPLGDSDSILVGEDICIIGNPLGELTYTMTKGIVSALGREINTDGKPIEMFQIDAAVNSGNSGGPAIDYNGQIVGIVTAKYSSDSVEGLGFCIPINDAVKIANDLIRYGYVKGKPAIGIFAEDAYDIYSYYYYYYGRHSSRLSKLSTYGIYISVILSGSPAEDAGLKRGDTIIAIDGLKIEDASSYEKMSDDLSPGDTVTLTVFREGDTFEVSMTLGEYIPSQYDAVLSDAKYKF